MHAPTPAAAQAWVLALQAALDELEAKLLQGDARGVEQASAALHGRLQQVPQVAALLATPGSPLRTEVQQAAQRLALLRQAVLRASAQSQRAVASLLPQTAQPTYGRTLGVSSSAATAGRAYLSA